MDTLLADRTQQHTREAAVPVAADNEQIRVLGLIDKHRSRVTAQHPPLHRYAGIRRRHPINGSGQRLLRTGHRMTFWLVRRPTRCRRRSSASALFRDVRSPLVLPRCPGIVVAWSPAAAVPMG
jgi:hypothetical protein